MGYNLNMDEIQRLNPRPRYRVQIVGDELVQFEEMLAGKWLYVGHIPAPKTRLGWFMWHILHGLLMRYPLHKVIGYACTHTKMEEQWTEKLVSGT
jgi:hypothetical protein